jgi:hypothetical protein
MADARSRPQGETEAWLKLNEHNSPVFELFADDAIGWEPQAVLIKAQRGCQVANANGDNRDSWLHTTLLYGKRVLGSRSLPCGSLTPQSPRAAEDALTDRRVRIAATAQGHVAREQ